MALVRFDDGGVEVDDGDPLIGAAAAELADGVAVDRRQPGQRQRGLHMVMYVTVVPNRSSPLAILPRESFRDNGKVRNRTLGESLGLDAVDEDDLHDAISTTAGPCFRRAATPM